jgi:GT2 family glycosyltransferase
LYVPEARVLHLHSATAGKFSVLKAFLIERNRVFVAVKTFPLPLLLLSPAFTALRIAFHAYGALFMVGSSGKFAADTSRRALALTMLRAYGSAFRHLPSMWSSRIRVRRSSRITNRAFLSLLWKHRIALRALTLGS